LEKAKFVYFIMTNTQNSDVLTDGVHTNVCMYVCSLSAYVYPT